jgi:hypothetical protein
MEDKKLWLVGQYKSGEKGNIVWEFQGIFSTEEKAVAACKNFRYWVAPIIMDEECPDGTVSFENDYYPISMTEDDIL